MTNIFKIFNTQKIGAEVTQDFFDSELFMLETERPSYIPLAVKRNGQSVENTSKDSLTIRALELKYGRSMFE